MYSEFEARLAAAVADGRIAGAVALVADRDAVTYQTVAGRRSVADGAPAMDADAVFWIASMTKAVVSVAALQLVEGGKLTLDGLLGGLLPDLKGLQVFDGRAADGTPRLRPARGEVTLRQLLTHTSGFGYGFADERIDAWMQGLSAAPAPGTRAWHRQPLLFDPGQGWAYGIGIDWAGIAIEAASGQRLDAYLAEHVFAPLEMAHTSFDPVREPAAMHARGADGELAVIPFGFTPGREVLPGGGGLYGTAGDYGRFLRMLLNDGELDGARVLSTRSVAELGQAHTGPFRAGTWTSASPTLSRDVDLFPGMHTGWGLAAMITPDAGPNGRDAGSLAWAGLANTYYWADPAAGKAGVMLTQVLPFGDPVVLDLFAALERGAYGLA